MNVALIDVDSRIPNYALMRLSTWHKQRGDSVKLYEHLLDAETHFDHAYASKMFRFTPDSPDFPDCPVEFGGPGYGFASLPAELDAVCPDYDLYPCEYAMGRFTRGCPNRCPWCVVHRTDGDVRQVAELADWYRGQAHIRLLDDNLTAMPDLFLWVCRALAETRARVAFEALDIRLIDDAAAEALMRVRRWGCLHFAWDDTKDEDAVFAGLAALKRAYPSLHDVHVYTLIGYGTGVDDWIYRTEKLRAFGSLPFVMPFNKTDPLQQDFARYWNNKAIARSIAFADYRRGMGHGKAAIA